MPRRRKKSAPVSQPEPDPKSRSFSCNLLYNTFQRENSMSEINPLVTAEAVKDALRSEDVRGALKQKVRQTFEAQIEAEVDAILDTLLGEQPEPEPQPEDITSENGDIQPESPVVDATEAQPEPGTML
ncbi:DUF826 domain-containing protein [Escherichia coli]|uniref:DUF826 domain-containing protein n=1 Tax=Escherichia coli TaxID=562 RepID=UPI001F2ECDB0|nr:DUF826 domain-containing protein [Escherichia coli]MCF3243736.1 DUF826 domain-containing protein [Escherichia coli]MCW3414971.1 DUF826 domain-containing protein [Escherichia coli]